MKNKYAEDHSGEMTEALAFLMEKTFLEKVLEGYTYGKMSGRWGSAPSAGPHHGLLMVRGTGPLEKPIQNPGLT